LEPQKQTTTVDFTLSETLTGNDEEERSVAYAVALVQTVFLCVLQFALIMLMICSEFASRK
jgi:hypothetical protein